MEKYIVWVGGSIVNEYLLTREQAEDLKMEYIHDGYTDVEIEALKTEFVVQ